MIVTNPLGLVFKFSDSGAVQSIDVDPIRISMRPPSALSRSCANLYLRKRGSSPSYTPLWGALSSSRFGKTPDGGFAARGSWAGLEYECLLTPARSQLSWQWRVRVDSRLDEAVELDLIYVQDVGLRAATAGMVNELYVSQYVERRVLEDPRHGAVVCCRQNAKESVGHPWLQIACASRAVAASTDGLQFYGNTFRSTGEPEALSADRLGGELAGESSVVALQHEPFTLGPAESRVSAFVATYVPDHPEATTELDLSRLPELVNSFDERPPAAASAFSAPQKRAFECAPLLPVDDLDRAELVALFGSAFRHPEELEGQLLSFFTDGPRHVVLRAKELCVDRPHGHIMQAHAGSLPDERIMSTTAFACGVFNSHLTQGNTNFNTLLSVCTHPATPALEGQRILVQLDDGEYLLGVPSAFELGLNHCRWIYKRGGTWIEVRTWTAPHAARVNLAVNVVRGGPVGLLLTHHFEDLNGWTVTPAASAHEFIARPHAESMVGERFPGAQFRLLVNTQDVDYRALGGEALGLDPTAPDSALFVLAVPEACAFSMSFVGEVAGPESAGRIDDPHAELRRDAEEAVSAWRELSRGLTLSDHEGIAAIREILPWYGMNALIHFLTPYGLEQFSGAAWGTRDVCQGPLDLLLSQEKYDEAKQVLRILFSHQSPNGGWPQWWMFDSYGSVRADSAHGDVVYWCILALCGYIRASGDFAFLDERLPYFPKDGCDKDGAQPSTETSVGEHVERIIALVVNSFVPGTALVQFGGGDWNDSLQPVSKELAERLISSWTVQMCFQAFTEYSEVCERAGDAAKAKKLKELSAAIAADFNRHLVKDGVVAGYGLVGADQTVEVLMHPSDTMTGVRYSLLPMDRGVISGLFSREQAEHHAELVERHLKGPDGARLMDRPLPYRGGPQTIFQRAESSTYFGREIGLMYIHEHIRYAESQARLGRPDAFLRALRQAIPVDYRELVPQGNLRQANCYYSSSDVAFKSRYEADERYHDVVAGNMPLKGGWRVYSSGPGLYLSLVVSRLLGLRVEFGNIVFDPVLARSLDGLTARLHFRERPVTFVYHVRGPGFGPRAITVNGVAAQVDREHNPYRQGGATLPLAQFMTMLGADENRVEIEL